MVGSEDWCRAMVGSMEGVSNVGGSGVARESRRRKTVWQAWQEKALLSAFSKSSYLSFTERQELARQVGVPECRIRVWFQNRRNRSGVVGQGPQRSTRGSDQLASQQFQDEHGSRAQGRGVPSEHRRPRTQITSAQRRILLQAFERNPRPGFATREELAHKTALPENTIHIWFQNRRRRHLSTGRPTNQDQDLLASHGPDEARGLPGGRELEGAQEDSLLPPQAAAARLAMDTASPSDRPTFCRESQPSQETQTSGAGQAQAPTQARHTDPLEFFLDQLLSQDQVQEHGISVMDLEQLDTLPELPLSQEDYQTLLDML